ncbi:alginate export family protein [bacterium]|nr:alginate export family protein [bacterium]
MKIESGKLMVLALLLMVALFSNFAPPQVFGGMNDSEDFLGIHADMRYRGEINAKDFNSNTDVEPINFLRSRITLKMKQGDLWAKFQLQNSNTFDWDSGQLNSNVAGDIHQAYVGIDNLLLPYLTLKIGRMMLKYGDERLVGAVGWSNVGRVFDGFLMKYDIGAIKIDAFLTKQVERDQADGIYNEPDDDFMGVWAKYDPLNLNLFVLYNSAADSNAATGYYEQSVSRTTIGLHYNNQYESGLGTNFTSAYQLGTKTALGTIPVDNDIAAWLIHLKLWYKLKDVSVEPSLFAGIDMTSGDDNSSDTEHNFFNDLYYTGHKFRGYMDYFLNPNGSTAASNPIKEKGLRDLFGGLKITPMEDAHVMIAVHNFATSTDYQSVIAANGKTSAIGNEIDLVADFKLKENLGVAAGYSMFMPSENWKGSNADYSHWMWLQLQTFLDWQKF